MFKNCKTTTIHLSLRERSAVSNENSGPISSSLAISGACLKRKINELESSTEISKVESTIRPTSVIKKIKLILLETSAVNICKPPTEVQLEKEHQKLLLLV